MELFFTEKDFSKSRRFNVRGQWYVEAKVHMINHPKRHTISIRCLGEAISGELLSDGYVSASDIIEYLNDFASLIRATREDFVEIKS